ncbi:MAG: family four-helix-bundle protein [Chitinophagaceae bacterium]|nr:family four-helix-bundle protein [Chitinophagaceae bacterium]
MEHNELTDLLNDLIRINGDRVEGYEKAAKELSPKNANLKILFEKNAKQSRQYYGDLSSLVVGHGGRPSSGTTNAGKVYRMWMDIRATLSDKISHSILASCEFGEDAAQRAYEKALEADIEIPEDVTDAILKQKAALQAAHDEIKKYRDMFESVGERI